MNVVIFKDHRLCEYDMYLPLEDQIKGSAEIIVNYVENDETVHHFLDEVERLSQSAFGFGLNIKVLHNNNIRGAKAKKLMQEAVRNLSVNDIIQMMAQIHKTTDDKLTEIAAICTGENYDE